MAYFEGNEVTVLHQQQSKQQLSALNTSKPKFYCLRQVHLAENLPRATQTKNRVKNTRIRPKTCFTYLG